MSEDNTRTITYPSGRVITEQKDLRDRLGDVSDTGGVIAQYSYDLEGKTASRAASRGHSFAGSRGHSFAGSRLNI